MNTKAFEKICTHFDPPEIDIFASRLNAQLPRFISWHPDIDAEAVDAFTVDWRKLKFYAFPPFCLIARCLQKITFDGAEGIMVVPNWPTQPWFARLRQMMQGEPLVLHSSKTLVTQLSLASYIHCMLNYLFCVAGCPGESTVQRHPRGNH